MGGLTIGVGVGVASLFLIGCVVIALLDWNAAKFVWVPWKKSKLKGFAIKSEQSQLNKSVEKGLKDDDNVLLSIKERTKFKTDLLEKDEKIKQLEEKLTKSKDSTNRISTALSDDVYFNVITQLKGNTSELYERNELQVTYSSDGRLKSILNDVFDHLGLKAKHQLKYDVFLGNSKSPIDASCYNKTLLELMITTGDTIHVQDMELKYE